MSWDSLKRLARMTKRGQRELAGSRVSQEMRGYRGRGGFKTKSGTFQPQFPSFRGSWLWEFKGKREEKGESRLWLPHLY